jgi:hypothetical protein
MHSLGSNECLITLPTLQVVEGEGTHDALTVARQRVESLSLSHPNVARMLAVGTQHMPAVSYVDRTHRDIRETRGRTAAVLLLTWQQCSR